MPKILVIDDDELFRQYLSTFLERAGYEVRGLANGSLVAAAMESERFDAIVSDLYMPGVDGLEIVSYVKRKQPGLLVIGITGASFGSSDSCSRAMSALGADAVLSKPLDGESLIEILRKSIGRAPRGSHRG
jgi:DNA-binding NtrC family response regulator